MFMIAAAYVNALDLGVEFKLSVNQFYGSAQGIGPEQYRDSIYSNIALSDEPRTPDYINIWEREWYYYNYLNEVRHVLKMCHRACIQGYRQSELHFKHRAAEIRALFTPKGGWRAWLLENHPIECERYKELFDEGHGYCFIGVRRGDYMTAFNRTIHNPCGMDYYTKAMKLLPSQRYYIASDDIEWCRRNFVGEQFRFFELGIKDDIIQLGLMTLFQKYICANSSFNWWGSYLSEHGDDILITVPDKWIFGAAVQMSQIWSVYRDNMLIVNREIEY